MKRLQVGDKVAISNSAVKQQSQFKIMSSIKRISPPGCLVRFYAIETTRGTIIGLLEKLPNKNHPWKAYLHYGSNAKFLGDFPDKLMARDAIVKETYGKIIQLETA